MTDTMLTTDPIAPRPSAIDTRIVFYGWQRAVHTLAKSKGWWSEGDTHDPEKIPTALAMVHSEVSEALEAYRDGNGGHHIAEVWRKGEKPEGFAVELADVVIRVLDLAEAYGIDLAEAMIAKHGYNKTRPHRHGGKRC